jgi:hypothetical protein
MVKNLALWFFFFKTFWITTVFLHMVFMFFLWFSSKLSLLILFFNIELVENYNCSFSHKTLWIAIVFIYMGLFFFYDFVFLYDFFQNYLCYFYFFYIKLVENLSLYFFSLKYCGLLQSFPTYFFLLWIFLKLSLSIFFLILSRLRIITVYFLTKHYRLLQCFPTWFFFLSFFCFFSKIIFVVFSWKHCRLQQSFFV